MDPEVLADGAALGDRFVALVGAPDVPGWLPATELFGAGLPAALTAVGRSRGTDSPALAGAGLFEQYAGRLVVPVLAALHRDGTVVDARLPAVRAELADGRAAGWRSRRHQPGGCPDLVAGRGVIFGGHSACR